MTKSYRLKLYPNSDKSKKLRDLLCFWSQEVNKKIDLFWGLEHTNSHCPAEYRLGGRLFSDASTKAWQVVKVAKKRRQSKPIFNGQEIDLNPCSITFCDFETKMFDTWAKVTCLDRYHRLALPCKKTSVFNQALKRGVLKKSAKILKAKKDYYLVCFVEIPKKESVATKSLGIDVGLTNTVATSGGNFYGQDLRPLRIKTKWRHYVGLSPFKQGLNRVANELVKTCPSTDFVVEDLLFKGKGKRSRQFRRRNNNWAYKHLSRKLEEHGVVEGFNVYYVDPAYTSQTCPACLFVNRLNRVGDSFKCTSCGYTNHADTVGAINILKSKQGEVSVPLKSASDYGVQRSSDYGGNVLSLDYGVE